MEEVAKTKSTVFLGNHDFSKPAPLESMIGGKKNSNDWSFNVVAGWFDKYV